MINKPYDSIITNMRSGNSDDPYVFIKATHKIINNKVELSEIPDKFNRVKVNYNNTYLNEVEDEELTDSLYSVNYPSGLVEFHSSKDGEMVDVEYFGKGANLFPSSRVYLNQEKNDIVARNIQDFADEMTGRVNNLISSNPQPQEIEDVRTDVGGFVNPTAKVRVDKMEQEVRDARQDPGGVEHSNIKARMDNEYHKIDVLSHKVGTSYAEWGAVLDGVTDDTEAIRAAHIYANNNGVPVIQRNSRFVLNGEVEVRTDVDLSGSELITKWVDSATIEYNRTSSLYKIIGDDPIDITNQVTKTEFSKGSTTIPSLSTLKSGSLIIKTMDIDLLRSDNGTIQNVYKNESNAISENSGGNLTYPLTKDYTQSTSFQVLYKPFKEQLTFILPELTLDNAKIYSLIKSERNNVLIKGGIVQEKNTSSTISPLYTIAEFYESHNITAVDVNCPIIGRNQKSGNNGLGYLFLFTKSSKINIENITQLYGWSGINGNWFRDISVRNSNILSVNGHANTYDLTVKDSRIYKDIQIHGGGILDIDNVTFEGRGTSVAITTRKDYASEFDGLIRVKNSVTISSLYFVQLNDVTHDCGRKVALPDVEISNCHMRQPIAQNTFLVTWRGFTGNFNATLPNIRIDNYSTSKLDVKHKTINFPQTISNTSISGEINITVNGARIPVTTFNSNPYTADLMNFQMPNISNNAVKIKMKVRDSLANFCLFGTSNIEVKCVDCDNYSIRSGTNSVASVTSNGELLKIHFENTNIYKGFCDFQTYNASSRFNMVITNSSYLKYTDKNGVVSDDVGLYIVDLIKFSSKNKSQPGTTLPSTNPTRLFNYNDTGFWVVV